jgi:hypothetical protein
VTTGIVATKTTSEEGGRYVACPSRWHIVVATNHFMTENSHEQQSGPPHGHNSSVDANSAHSTINHPQNVIHQSQSSPPTTKSKGLYFLFSEYDLWRGPYMKNQTDQSDISTR